MTAIVVLGMHRSGTSAITRALGLLGASLGPEQDLGQYWESHAMRSVSEHLLEGFGGAWDCPPVLAEGWPQTEVARSVVEEARAALAGFGDAPGIVWKDPRTCLTLPFWRDVLGEDMAVVFIHRHPVEVAGSLESRNQLGTALSFALWERYNRDALRGAVGLRARVVPYGELLDRPEQVMRDLVDTLAGWGVALPGDPGTTDLELRTSRRHHHSEPQLDHPASTPSQRGLFELLAAADGVHASFALPGPLLAPSPLSLELLDARRALRAARRELWQARTDLRRLAGSRRRLLRALLRPGRTATDADTEADDQD